MESTHTTTPLLVTNKITLYGYVTSPYVNKVGMFLKYKRLPFDLVPVHPVFPLDEIGFTNQRKVPVLKIGEEEWKTDSTPIGIWIDERFPDAYDTTASDSHHCSRRTILGDTAEEKEKILSMDKWVTDQLLAGIFRAVIDWNRFWCHPLEVIRDGWKLAKIVSHFTWLDWLTRFLWPFALPFVPFIKRHARPLLQSNESLTDMKDRQCQEFVNLLEGGPYLGGLQKPSLADLSAYSALIFPYLLGFSVATTSPFFHNDHVLSWMRRVQEELPDNNPTLIPEEFFDRSLP